MTTPKSKQVAPVVHPNPPIPLHIAMRRLEAAYTKKCEELERAQKHIAVLEAKMAEMKAKKKK